MGIARKNVVGQGLLCKGGQKNGCVAEEEAEGVDDGSEEDALATENDRSEKENTTGEAEHC